MKNRILFMFGAILFLMAQLILPQGSVDEMNRMNIIRTNQLFWNLGHVLIILSMPLLMHGFVSLKELAQLISPNKAFFGLLFVFFGLSAEASLAALQLATEGIVSSNEEHVARQIIANGFNTSIIQATLLIPYLLILPGSILLAIPLFRINNYRLLAISLTLFGLLMVSGGILQIKVLFILAGLALVFVFWKTTSGLAHFNNSNN